MSVQSAYFDYLLTNGKRPVSVYSFCKENGEEEKSFFNSYSSFEALEAEFFESIIDEITSALKQGEEWSQFNGRERLISLLFALVEKFKENRSLIQFLMKDGAKIQPNPPFLSLFKKKYMDFTSVILKEAEESKEVKERGRLNQIYNEALWLHFMFVLRFWLHDKSKMFDKTDEAIEKSTHLFFDLVGNSPLDAMLEFGKFLYQNRQGA